MRLILIIFLLYKVYSIIPIYKILLSDNVNNITELNYKIDTKGIGLTFDSNSEYNLLPYDLFYVIKSIYSSIYFDCFPYDYILENELITLKCQFYLDLRLIPMNIIYWKKINGFNGYKNF